jgi:chromosome segregation ATPase
MFRKRLLGYQPSAVDEALEARDAALRAANERVAAAEAHVGAGLAELEARRIEARAAARRIAELEHVSARLATMVVDRDKELRRLRGELRASLERDDGGLRAIAAMAGTLDMVRRQAGRQATRIRLRALREAVELGQALAELDRVEGPARERLLARIEEAVGRVGAEDDWVDEDLAARAEANGHAKRETGELFDGLVEVEVGPLSDFSQLVGFEDAANEIGATSEISVKRFTQGRATLAMRFKHPVELLRELEERAPFEFVVRDTRSDRIVLDLDE